MKVYSLFIFINFYCIYKHTSIKIKPKLKKNILKYVYGINYKYEGKLVHSFDRFYVVTKFILPSIKELTIFKLNYVSTCTYLTENNGHTAKDKLNILDLLVYCKIIKPYVDYHKQQIKSYNDTVHHILKK